MDGATAEVIRSYLGSAAEEMRATLIRTAFNPVIYEVLDFGISIYSDELDLIAEAPGLTHFLGANDYAIRKGVEYVGADNVEPGDVVLMNYPYWNAAHSYDATLFSAFYAEGATSPTAYLCVRAHWMDLGAKDPGYVLDSTSVFQEGILFPGTKIFKRGRADHELLELIRFNSRLPDLVIGDVHAQVAALRTGERRLGEIYARYGKATIDEAIQTILDHGEEQTRRALLALPQGSWTATDVLDDDGIDDTPVPMQVTVTIANGELTVDFAGSAGATAGPVNMPFGATLAMCKVALKALTTPDEPGTGGHMRPLRVLAEPGTLFHAISPAPTFTLWTGIVALELIFKAVAQGMEGRVAASTGGDVPGFMMVGIHPDTGEMFAVSNNEPVGWGGTPRHDGANGTMHLSASIVRNTPIEVLESKTLMLVESLEFRTDSGGAGRRRGGAGLRRMIRFLGEGEFLSVVKKTRTAPWGLAGGRDGLPNGFVLNPGTPQERAVSTHRTAVKTGDRILVLSGGGGGHGDPKDRDRERVLEDVREGYVSVEAAARDYGVTAEEPT
ncbi:MAG: hydantoinase B/oxoprolinase family protein [Gaiellales bacterium]